LLKYNDKQTNEILAIMVLLMKYLCCGWNASHKL